MKTTLAVLFALAMTAVAAFGIYAACIPSPPPDTAALERLRRTVTVVDADGEPIPTLCPQAAFVPVAELPAFVPSAFVAIEDKRFYSHRGVDPKRLFAAFVKNLFAGRPVEGGSTITQQLVKNVLLSPEKTLARKIAEIRHAEALEKIYDKDEILSFYLNAIYFGHNLYGIESAARYYFAKSARELTLTQAAALAAAINAPARYSPLDRPDDNAARRALVLRRMREQGYIDDARLQAALEADLGLSDEMRADRSAYYAAAALAEARALVGAPDGWRIETFLRPRAQAILCASLTDADGIGSAKAILTDADGHIVAAAGDVDTVGLKRQPGSAIKPLLVYAPALEKGVVSPATPILDEKIDFDGYAPSNYGGGHSGWISVREALSASNNVAAVRIMQATGVDVCCDYAARLGLPLDEKDRTLAAALGGLTYGVTLERLTQAHSALTHGGSAPDGGYVARIVDASGRELYRAPDVRRPRPDYARQLVTDLMRTCASDGTAAKLGSIGCDVAAKTGTVGDATGNSDAYCIASTTAHTLGVWYGGDLPLSVRGGTAPAQTAREILLALCRTERPRAFATDALTTVRLDRDVYRYDHRLALAPRFATDAQTYSEVFFAPFAPAGTDLRAPTLSLSRDEGAVLLTIRGDRYADCSIVRTSPHTCDVFPVGKLGSARERTVSDAALAPGTLYGYRVVALYPDGTSRSSDEVRVLTASERRKTALP